MSDYGKLLKGKRVYGVEQMTERLYSRILRERGGFHTSAEEKPTMWWARIYALAVTDSWTQRVEAKPRSGSTPKNSNILSFSRSSASGTRRR